MELSPQGLAQLYNLPPEAVPAGMRLQDQLNQGNTQSLQAGQQTNDFNEQANPYRLSQLGLQNDTTSAQLPGLQAQSQMLQRKNSLDALFNDDNIKKLHQQYGSEALQGHLKDLNTVGDLYTQGAGLIAANPIAGKAALKQALASSGHSEAFPDAWDNLDPETLATTLQQNGKDIQNGASKINTSLASLDAKNATTLEAARIAADAKRDVQQMKNDSAKRVADAKQSNNPKTIEAAYADTLARYNKETDPDKKDILAEEANQYRSIYQGVLQLKGQAAQIGNVNGAAVAGLPAKVAPEIPPIGESKPDTVAPEYNTWTMDQWQKRYPNATPDQIKAAAKAKGLTIK